MDYTFSHYHIIFQNPVTYALLVIFFSRHMADLNHFHRLHFVKGCFWMSFFYDEIQRLSFLADYCYICAVKLMNLIFREGWRVIYSAYF